MKNIFEDVPEEKTFWLDGGGAIKNLYQLAEALGIMKEKTFKFHVNKNKNDFSEWIRQVIEEEKLADEVARLVMKDKIQIVLQKHIIQRIKENGNKDIPQ